MGKLSLLVGALALCSCGVFGGAKSPKLELFECQAAALAPYVGDVLDARELMRDVYVGKANLDAVASFLKLTQAQREAFNAASSACDPEPAPASAPKETSAKLVAPPPQYGNKIL